MDQTPGGHDESAVPAHLRAGRIVDTTVRIASLVQTTSSVVFGYVAQVGGFMRLLLFKPM